jgi:hypothetical protein
MGGGVFILWRAETKSKRVCLVSVHTHAYLRIR